MEELGVKGCAAFGAAGLGEPAEVVAKRRMPELLKQKSSLNCPIFHLTAIIEWLGKIHFFLLAAHRL